MRFSKYFIQLKSVIFCDLLKIQEAYFLQAIYLEMSNLFYNRDSVGQQMEGDRGFKKSLVNVTFQRPSLPASEPNKLPTYTYRTLDQQTGQFKDNFFDRQGIEIKSPQSLTTFTKINFSQRASSSIHQKQKQKQKEQERMKAIYQGIDFRTTNNQLYQEQKQPIKFAKKQPEFYRKDSKLELSRAKSNSSILSPKQENSEHSLINGLQFTDPSKSQIASSKQIEDHKLKVLRLQRELTQMSLQKGQLILQLAQLSRENSDIKKQLNQFKQKQLQKVQSVQVTKNNDSNKVQIDKELLIEIQNISQRQKQINQTKEQFIQLAAAGYQKQIKRLMHHGGLLKLQNQRINVELTIAKQDLRQKQLKLQFLQKEMLALQQKQKQNSKAQNEKYNQIMTLKHSLKALQTKYKAQSRELANKQDYILKYIVNRGGSQDLEAIKGLTSHTRQIEDMSEVQSQLQSQSQVHSVKMLNSRQP